MARVQDRLTGLHLGEKLAEGHPELGGDSTVFLEARANILEGVMRAASLTAKNPAALSAPGEHPGPNSSLGFQRFKPPPRPAEEMELDSAAEAEVGEEAGESATAPAEEMEQESAAAAEAGEEAGEEAGAEAMAEVGTEEEEEEEPEATLPPYPKSYGNNMAGEKRLARRP